MKFAQMRVRSRLFTGFGTIVLFVIVIAALGLRAMTQENQAMHQIVDVNVKKMSLLEDMSNAVHITSRVVRSIALLQNEASRSDVVPAQIQKIRDAQQHYDAAYETLKRMPLDQKGRAFVEAIEVERREATQLNERFLQMEETDKSSAVIFLIEKVTPATTAWQESIHDFIGLQREKNQSAVNEASSTFESSRWELVAISVSIVLVSVAFSLFISNSIVKQLGCEPHQAIMLASEVAKGNLACEIRTSNARSDSLIVALHEMQMQLRRLVSEVNQSAEVIADAARDIAAGNLDLSSRTEEQAASLEETAASIEELSSTVRHNALNASEADALARQASLVASNGGEMVARAVSTMEKINDASKQIVDIISVIDGIAFQTNILALNAAVEAARAGEQGRGFAVVASEVRILAQRSATAAKEIKFLIGNSVGQVNDGCKIVDAAGEAMHEVVESIRRVSAVVNEIANASSEQTAGIDQINVAVTMLDQVTQQNAALVEEAAATSESLHNQTNSLRDLVHAFKLAQPAKRHLPAQVEQKKLSHRSTRVLKLA